MTLWDLPHGRVVLSLQSPELDFSFTRYDSDSGELAVLVDSASTVTR